MPSGRGKNRRKRKKNPNHRGVKRYPWVLEMLKLPCHYCNGEIGPTTTIDAKIPRCKGGTHTQENCVPACFACNHWKDDMTYDETMWALKEGLRGEPKTLWMGKLRVYRFQKANPRSSNGRTADSESANDGSIPSLGIS